MSPRWRKLWGDVRGERARLGLMLAAVAVSVTAVGAVLGGWAVLTREIRANYLGTRPADATLELEQGVDDATLALVRADPSVEAAERREVLLARARVGDDFRPVLLFVPDDFTAMRVNTFRLEHGAWPPPDGAVLLERSAVAMAGATEGGRLELRTPHGGAAVVPIAGLVHDPGLAPAWQEREVYAYATKATLVGLGEGPALHELRVRFSAAPRTAAQAEALADALADRLKAAGVAVHQLRVPPPGQHPHQRQMETILLLLLTFAALTLALSAVLVATTLSALLARQVRELAVLKTLGATRGALTTLYSALVVGLGVAALVPAVPLGVVGALGLSRAVSGLLNFTLTSTAVPAWVFAVQTAAAVLVPLACAAVPILGAARLSVRAALDDHGATPGVSRLGAGWPVAVRDLLRRPRRLALTLALLATAGALFMTALAVRGAWSNNLEKINAARHYDLEVRFNEAVPVDRRTAVADLPGLAVVEPWGLAPAALARADRADLVRTYPDRGHGSLWVMAPPPATRLVTFPLLAGRALTDADEGAVVLNHVAWALLRSPAVGQPVVLSVDGRRITRTLRGVVEEVGSPGIAYLTPADLAQVVDEPGRVRMWRVVTTASSPAERATRIREVEAALARAGLSVETVVPFAELRTAIGDHISILVQALLALAVVMAVVGLLGLTSSVGMSVLERSRELGVLKALGATRATVRRRVLTEALVTSVASVALAVLASLPLSWAVEALVGQLGFMAPLPFTLAPWAMLGWLALVLGFTVGAAWGPVEAAARLTVREALAQL